MSDRRRFIKQAVSLGALGLVEISPLQTFAKATSDKLTILYTNDWHSRLEPFDKDGGPYSGQGGAAYRSALIKKIRSEEKNVLLLDAGDIFQGTPYFNYFGGEPEYKIMTAMGYDCVTLGNHDFDNGIEGILKQLPHAGFQFVNCNYDLSETDLKDVVKPYKIINKGNIRIGITGVGIDFKGLVPDKLCKGVKYNDPVSLANNMATWLKKDKKCDLVICLSHLGYEYKNDKMSDIIFARLSKNIDLILGGHTHTFLEEAILKTNADGKDVVISQAGWAGLRLGRIDYVFNALTGAELAGSEQLVISQDSI